MNQPDTQDTGEVLIGRYRLAERIGRGEFGDVFLADDLLRASIADGAPVALKMLRADFVHAAGGIGGISSRLAAACRFSHPNVINAFDFYEDGEGSVFLVMEHLSGPTLAEMLREKGGPPDVAEADRLLRQLLDGLIHIHESTPVLRLHPARVFLPTEDCSLRIADLGLAPLLDPALLRQTAIASGTTMFTAPEILAGSGDPPDQRADQYSLGAIAMTLFLGSPKASMLDLSNCLSGTPAAGWLDCLPRLLTGDPSGRFDDLKELREILPSRQSEKNGRRSKAASTRPTQRTLRCAMAAALIAVVVALVILGWKTIPGRLAERRLQSGSFSGDEAGPRQLLNHIDHLRLDLCASALARPEFAEGIRQLAKSGPDLDAAALIASAPEARKQGDQSSAQSVRFRVEATLRERIEQFHLARQAIERCDELATARATAAAIAEPPGGSDASTLNAFDAAWNRAIAEFAEARFDASLETARAGTYAARHHIAAAVEQAGQEAKTARDAWLSELAKLGRFPAIEPIGRPGEQIAAGEAATTAGEPVKAIEALAAARRRYREWTDELANPREASAPSPDQFTNSLGMRFVPVGEVLASIWETRLVDYLAFVEETGVDSSRQWREFAAQANQGPLHPVAFINRSDAVRFGQWLTSRERQSGRIADNQVYRLPTDLEWSLLVGIEDDPKLAPHERSLQHPFHFPWGNEAERRAENGNYDTFPNREFKTQHVLAQDPFLKTAPVGSFPPNSHGIHDLGGNVWEWTTDLIFGAGINSDEKVLRGGGWRSINLETMRSAYRLHVRFANAEIGFRLLLAPRDSTSNSPNDGP